MTIPQEYRGLTVGVPLPLAAVVHAAVTAFATARPDLVRRQPALRDLLEQLSRGAAAHQVLREASAEPPTSGLMTSAEAAEMLGCSQRSVTRRLERGELEGSKQAGVWLVDASSLPDSRPHPDTRTAVRPAACPDADTTHGHPTPDTPPFPRRP